MITDTINEKDIPQFLPDMMIKILATIDDDNKPNLVFINSFEANDNKTLTFAEFIWGKSKRYLQDRKKCAVDFLTLDNHNWIVKGDFDHWEYDGDKYDYYMHKDLFRNNAYTGITRVGYINVKKVIAPKTPVKTDRKVVKILKNFVKEGKANIDKPEIMPKMVEPIFKGTSNMKFIGFIDTDGYPMIIPTMELVPVNLNRLILFRLSVNISKPHSRLLYLLS